MFYFFFLSCLVKKISTRRTKWSLVKGSNRFYVWFVCFIPLINNPLLATHVHFRFAKAACIGRVQTDAANSGVLRTTVKLFKVPCVIETQCSRQFLFSKSLTTLKMFKDRQDKSLSVCLCVCLSLASDSSKTIIVFTINLGTVTTSDMRMHHVLIILTLTFN